VIAESFHALIVFAAAVLPWLAVFGPIVYLLVKWRRKKKREKREGVGEADARNGETEDGKVEKKEQQ
jgi:heme/copper-type cytochrome/quinol oxidase subunit 2